MNLRRGLVVTLGLNLLIVAAELHAQAGSYAVGQGDVLEITVYAGGEQQEQWSDAVSADGTITCPLLGEIKVGGMVLSEITTRLKLILGRDYFVDPQVLVSLKEYGGKIFVLGEVTHPGVYPMRQGLTLLNVCVLAGGFTDYAAPRRALVTRVVDGRPKLIGVDLLRVKQNRREDLILQSGDRVDVPRRRF